MEPYERLDKALDDRRLALKMEWTEVAAAVGMTPRTLLNIRRGRHGVRDLNARRMDEWLSWEPGSVKSLLAGGRPGSRDDTTSADSEPPATDDSLAILADRVRSDPELARAIAVLAARAIKSPPPPEDESKPGETRAS